MSIRINSALRCRLAIARRHKLRLQLKTKQARVAGRARSRTPATKLAASLVTAMKRRP